MPLLFNNALCPVTAVTAVLLSGHMLGDSIPIFSCFDREMYVLTQSKFNARLQCILSAMGFQANEYSSHSFRRGGATWVFSVELPGEIIQMIWDWKSDAYKIYLETSVQTKLKFMSLFSSSLPKL